METDKRINSESQREPNPETDQTFLTNQPGLRAGLGQLFQHYIEARAEGDTDTADLIRKEAEAIKSE